MRIKQMLHANLLNTEDIDPNAFRGNRFESVCFQISSTRKKGKQIWTPQRAKEQLIELAAEDTDRDDEVLEAILTTNVAFLKATVLKFAEKNDLTCYVLCGRRLEHKITAPKRNNVEPLIFAEWDTRLYFYTGAKTKEKVAHMVVRPPREIPAVVLKTDPKRKPREIEIPRELGQTWEEDPAHLPPGEYITKHRCNDPDEWDIQKVRVRLLLAGVNAEVNICSLHNGYYYNRLTFTRAGGTPDDTVTFRSTQPNWAESREFARAFSAAHPPLPYRLQTQAVLTHEALLYYS